MGRQNPKNAFVPVMPMYYDMDVLKDKKRLIAIHIQKMVSICQRIFEWERLPETIPQREFEIIVQMCRFAIFKKVNGDFYVFFGGLGGLPDVYYHPSDAIIANPYLKYFDVCEIDKDCVIVWNDSARMGLLPIHNYRASQLAEIDISLRWATIWTRTPAMISASDDNTEESAQQFIKKIEEGAELAVVGENGFFEGVKSHDLGTYKSSVIKDLIEEQQYIKSSWLSDIGLNANFNMKRESLNAEEVALNEDALIPFIDDMLEERKLACEKINKMFGLNISVKLSSAWEKMRREIKTDEKIQESKIDENPEPEKEPETKTDGGESE